MAGIFLDTTVLIDTLRGKDAALRIASLEMEEDLYTCAINIEEVMRGAWPRERAGAGRLFSGLRIVPLGRVEGERAAGWRRGYGAKGLTLSQADCLVAAAAFSVGARLATGNPKHFPMPDLLVDHWPAGA